MDVVGEAGDGEEAFALAERERPDVVLLDLDLPGMDGLETTRRIFSEPALEGVRVIVLSVSDADDHLFGALRAGASAFLVKDTEPADLLEAVQGRGPWRGAPVARGHPAADRGGRLPTGSIIGRAPRSSRS